MDIGNFQAIHQPRCFLIQRLIVDQYAAGLRQIIQKDVFRHREVSYDAQLLVDHGDALVDAVAGVMQIQFFAGKIYLAFIFLIHAGHDFDKC